MVESIKITKIMMLRVIITSVISLSIFIYSLTVFSESEIENRSIIAKICYEGTLPVFKSQETGYKEFLSIYDDNTVRVLIPDGSNSMHREVKLSKKKTDEIREKLLSSRITDNKHIKTRFFHNFVDIGYIIIKVYYKDNVYFLGSRLPYIEKDANIVVTDKGEHILEKNETKEKYISEHSSEDYKRFRNAWDQCFNVLDDLYLEITEKRIVEK